ncbi:MAG: alanine--tRNA ligase [Candidatus Bathyarchaeota archaeon]
MYKVKIFEEEDFIRRKCTSCGRSFWTLNPDTDLCGDQPCVHYSFFGAPPTKKSYDISIAREMFLSFFENRKHKRVGKYPTVARWRNDVFFVGASIYDFQPWVTDGIVPPPANPLVISQPCVRFTDIDSVGKSGRHLTSFEMMAHHAFNNSKTNVYWTDETVAYCFEFLTKNFGINPEKINFIEDMWVGGGNAGEDFEVVVDGIELATLVFLHYKTENDKLIPLDNLTVDTGYGLERMAWLSKGSPTIYDATFESIIGKLRRQSGYRIPDRKIFIEASKLAGIEEIKTEDSLRALRTKIAERVGTSPQELEELMKPMESIYSIADFTRTIIYLLGDGIVPSNVEEGYLARLLIRKSIRNMSSLNLTLPLNEIVALQLNEISRDFPEYKEKSEIILNMVNLEEKRYQSNLERGREIVYKKVEEAKARGSSSLNEGALTQLYDSHGLTPDFVSQLASNLEFKVNVPSDFYSKIAKLHEKISRPEVEVAWVSKLKDKIAEVPPTKMLYYEEPYRKQFEAELLKLFDGQYLVLDRTAFYPEGGGQPADGGVIKLGDAKIEVTDVQKVNNVIIHAISGVILPVKGKVNVSGEINWNKRHNLMRNHTATHVLLGAAIRVLGDHVWQSGAQKDIEKSRLDISHYEKLSTKQITEIEKRANEIVTENLPVEISWMSRESAESQYGFRIYQGGLVPGKEIRIVKVKDWNVEACGGIHCTSTGEIGLIKIIRSERIQDGVERLIFSVGSSALQYIQQQETKLKALADMLGCPVADLEKVTETLLSTYKSSRKETEKLKQKLAKYDAHDLLKTAEEVNGLKLLQQIIEKADVETVIKTSTELVNAEPSLVTLTIGVDEKSVKLVVMAGDKAVKAGANAGEIAIEVAKVLGGGGGGKQSFGQGGSEHPEKVPEAQAVLKKMVKKQLERI